MGSLADAPAEARARMMLQRISTFIDRNLGDPALTPRAVAAHHRISLCSLYPLFGDPPVSIAACIRRRRLERCRADLVSAHLSSHPVEAVAARWGFASASAFGRAFREAYGIASPLPCHVLGQWVFRRTSPGPWDNVDRDWSGRGTLRQT
ncbi:helix-turn-helix domain-containing protein [Streptomyces sp. NPDC096136]|uniref:helix-turn-helix domain-containing protein n=1 Tax=Streptomyces sp. NPDC096136 TaxID=3366076 RepID=UPI0038070766